MPTVPNTRPSFRGLWLPLVTPFLNQAVDHPALAALAAQAAADGVTGLVVCGSTGEAAALSADEQLQCLATVAAAAPGLPLVMGMSGYHLGETRAWVQDLGQQGRDLPALRGLLLPAPHYVRPPQSGLRHWFETLADASTLPLIVYDIPYRTGAVITRDTLLALAAHPNIRAIKDCGGDTGKTLALIADGRLEVLAGEDLQIFSLLAQGGAGAIAASAHIRTPHFVALCRALAAGDLPAARTIWRGLVPLIEALFAEPNPGPLKALLAAQGRLQNELRAPMAPASAELAERLRALEAALSPC